MKLSRTERQNAAALHRMIWIVDERVIVLFLMVFLTPEVTSVMTLIPHSPLFDARSVFDDLDILYGVFTFVLCLIFYSLQKSMVTCV